MAAAWVGPQPSPPSRTVGGGLKSRESVETRRIPLPRRAGRAMLKRGLGALAGCVSSSQPFFVGPGTVSSLCQAAPAYLIRLELTPFPDEAPTRERVDLAANGGASVTGLLDPLLASKPRRLRPTIHKPLRLPRTIPSGCLAIATQYIVHKPSGCHSMY